MGVLLDTSILIAAERGDLSLAESDPDTELAVPAIAAHELWRGVARLRPGVARVRAERWIESLLSWLPIVPYDDEVARVHAALWVELSARGITLGAYDQIVAATALHLEYDLATRDKAFARVPTLTLRRW